MKFEELKQREYDLRRKTIINHIQLLESRYNKEEREEAIKGLKMVLVEIPVRSIRKEVF
jgi:hypothetical protein